MKLKYWNKSDQWPGSTSTASSLSLKLFPEMLRHSAIPRTRGRCQSRRRIRTWAREGSWRFSIHRIALTSKIDFVYINKKVSPDIHIKWADDNHNTTNNSKKYCTNFLRPYSWWWNSGCQSTKKLMSHSRYMCVKRYHIPGLQNGLYE